MQINQMGDAVSDLTETFFDPHNACKERIAELEADKETADLCIKHLSLDNERMKAERDTRCEGCDEWDGPMGNGFGKCGVWTIDSSPANPGCGQTHFRYTAADGYCYRWAKRMEE